MKKLYITNEQMHGHVSELIYQMVKDNWKPELIIGVTRGGALPAVLLSHFFNVKMVGLDVSLRDSDMGPETNAWAAEDAMNGKKILIVDDINDTGATINWIMDDWDIPSGKIKWGDNVRFAVVVNNEASKAKRTPEYSSLQINKAEEDVWIVFPYEDWWKKDIA
jgi:hypoxanthine phosphoribosyltransferase